METTRSTKITAEEAIAKMRANQAQFEAMTEAQKLEAKRNCKYLVRVVEFEGRLR